MNDKNTQTGGVLPQVASIKEGGKDNQAYAGIPQSDDPKILNILGNNAIPVDANSVLAGYLQGVFQAAKDFRESNKIEQSLTSCLRQFKGQYEPEEEAELRARGFPLVYFPLSEHKVHTAVAWLEEFFTNGENLVSLKPTPSPETEEDITKMTLAQTLNDVANASEQTGQIPPPEMIERYAEMMRPLIERHIKTKSNERVSRMERIIKDDMVQGRWAEHVHNLISIVCVYGTGGFRCPIVKKRKQLAWEKGKIVRKERITREFESISPFDLFPSAGMTDTQHGDLCVRVRYRPTDLISMKTMPLCIADAIDEVVGLYGGSGVRLEASSDSERQRLTEQQNTLGIADGALEGFEFWGQVSGDKLCAMGITKDPKGKDIKDTAYDWYEINAIVIGNKVIFCRVMQDAEERPIDVVKFYDTPGQFFGRGPLHLINHLQRICNAAGRATVTNMGFSSMPQSVVDLSSIAPQDDMKMRPGKVWSFRPSATMNQNSKGVSFFTVESISRELTSVFEFYQRLADEITGIPSFANGTDAAVGAARTATGLNMLMGASNRGIKKIVGNFDTFVEKSVRRLYWWHMMFNKDNTIKGDVSIEVCGLKYFSSKTAQANERLNLIRTISQDPRMSQIQSPEALVRLLREIAPGFDISPDDLAPNEDELARLKEEQARRAQEQQIAIQQQQQEQAMQQQQQNVARGGKQAIVPQSTPTGRPHPPSREQNGGMA